MFGKYASYIIPAYAVTAIVIAGLIVWIAALWRHRSVELERLEAETAAKKPKGKSKSK